MKEMVIQGKVYPVKDRLSTKELYDMGGECALRMYDIDEDLGVVWEKHTSDAILSLVALKYFCGVDIDQLDGFEAQCEAIDQFEKWMDDEYSDEISRAMGQAKEIAGKVIAGVRIRVEREKSLDYKLGKALGPLLEGLDAQETLAQSTAMKEDLLNLMERAGIGVGEDKDRAVNLGRLLNFAKKEQ